MQIECIPESGKARNYKDLTAPANYRVMLVNR